MVCRFWCLTPAFLLLNLFLLHPFNVVEIILIVICSLLVYRNTFLKSVTVFWDIVCLVNSVKFSLYRITLSVNKVFYFLPYKQNIFYFIFFFYYIARTFRIRLKRSGASGHSCFVPDLISGKKLFSVHTTLGAAISNPSSCKTKNTYIFIICLVVKFGLNLLCSYF